MPTQTLTVMFDDNNPEEVYAIYLNNQKIYESDREESIYNIVEIIAQALDIWYEERPMEFPETIK